MRRLGVLEAAMIRAVPVFGDSPECIRLLSRSVIDASRSSIAASAGRFGTAFVRMESVRLGHRSLRVPARYPSVLLLERTRASRNSKCGANVNELHGAANKITKQTALNERGQTVFGRGDTPNRHDIVTGTKSDGTVFSPNDPDMTCGDSTRSGAEGAAVVGRHDRVGPAPDP